MSCFYYVFHAEEEIYYQLPDADILKATASTLTDSNDLLFIYLERSLVNVFISESSLFKIYMTTFIRRDDTVLVFEELKNTWITMNQLVDGSIQLMMQREWFTMDG